MFVKLTVNFNDYFTIFLIISPPGGNLKETFHTILYLAYLVGPNLKIWTSGTRVFRLCSIFIEKNPIIKFVIIKEELVVEVARCKRHLFF